MNYMDDATLIFDRVNVLLSLQPKTDGARRLEVGGFRFTSVGDEPWSTVDRPLSDLAADSAARADFVDDLIRQWLATVKLTDGSTTLDEARAMVIAGKAEIEEL